MNEINFRLSEKEAELLMNALQNQTNGIIQKMQNQYAEQTQPMNNDAEQILTEEENNV